jgi:nitrous oxide reductase accessory protein NosL
MQPRFAPRGPPGFNTADFCVHLRWHEYCKLAAMNKNSLLLVALAASALAAGCKNSADNAKDSPTATDHYDYAYDKRDVYLADANADVAALDRKIDELAARAASAADNAKAEAQPKIEELRRQRAVLVQKLEALKKATAADWNEAKSDYLKSYNEAKTSCQNAWQRLTDKL